MKGGDIRAGLAALFLVAAMVFACAADTAVVDANGIRTQGRWSYTQRRDEDFVEYMAATPSVQDSETWLLVACRADDRLNVILTRTTRFEFALDAALRVSLRSTSLPDVSVVGKIVIENQIALDPRVMRHVAPLLIEEDQVTILIPDTTGTGHEYTFLMQPNDIALAPLRSRCLAVETDT